MEGKTDKNEARCPSLEEIAAFLDGRLTEAQRLTLVKHASNCETCAGLLAETARQLESDGTPMTVSPLFRRHTVLPIAVGVGIAALVALAVLIPRRNVRQLDRAALIEALGGQRPFEPRLTGGFPYGPMRPVMRSASPESQPYKLLAAAAKIKETADAHESAETLASLGAAQLVLGESENAVKTLEEASLLDPKNARILTDLAAAYLVHAQEKDHPEDITKALEAAEKATELDPKLLEAWFDRAYALETLPLKSEAAKAWRDYLKRDPKSEWADEARKRLAAIDAIPNHSDLWKRDKGLLLGAAEKGDDATVRKLVSHYCQETREMVEEELLPQWAEAFEAGNTPNASKALANAAVIVRAQNDLVGDRLLPDTIARIEECFRRRTPDDNRNLAAGFIAYRDARAIYRKGDLVAASPIFVRSAFSLRAAKSPFLEWPEYFIAAHEYFSGDLGQASRRLQELQAIADSHSYLAFGSRSRWLQALIHAVGSRFTESLAEYRGALRGFELVRETANQAWLHGLIAENLFYLGEDGEAWRERCSALRLLTSLRDSSLGQGVSGEAAGACLTERLPRVALHLEDSTLGLFSMDPAGEADMRVTRALIEVDLGQRKAAATDLQATRGLIRSVTDRDRLRRLEADTDALGAEIESKNATESVVALGRAIGTFRKAGIEARLPRLCLLRGQGYRSLGDLAKAQADFQSGIEDFERRRASQHSFEPSYFGRANEIFQEMVRLQSIDRRDPESGLSFVERNHVAGFSGAEIRSGPPFLVASLRKISLEQIPRDVDLVYYSVLDDQTLIWCARREGTSFRRIASGAAEISQLVTSYREALGSHGDSTELSRLSRTLYRDLIDPIASQLREGSVVVIIPDDVLALLPYSSLQNARTGRYFIQDHAVAMAPSGTQFAAACRSATHFTGSPRSLSALVVGDPLARSVESLGLPKLPGSAAEAREVASLYERRWLLTGSEATPGRFLELASVAEIIHFGGHAMIDMNRPDLSRMVFSDEANRPGSGSLFAAELSKHRFPNTRLVVLAACETALGRVYHGDGPASLARPFLSAGVPDVVASLWNVDDRSSESLLVEFHRNVVAGLEPVEALRQSQLKQLKSPDPTLASPRHWSAFELFGGVVEQSGDRRQI